MCVYIHIHRDLFGKEPPVERKCAHLSTDFKDQIDIEENEFFFSLRFVFFFFIHMDYMSLWMCVLGKRKMIDRGRAVDDVEKIG